MHPSIRGVAQLCELNVSSTTVAARVKDDRYKIILAKHGNVRLGKARIVGIKSFLLLGNNQNEMGNHLVVRQDHIFSKQQNIIKDEVN